MLSKTMVVFVYTMSQITLDLFSLSFQMWVSSSFFSTSSAEPKSRTSDLRRSHSFVQFLQTTFHYILQRTHVTHSCHGRLRFMISFPRWCKDLAHCSWRHLGLQFHLPRRSGFRGVLYYSPVLWRWRCVSTPVICGCLSHLTIQDRRRRGVAAISPLFVFDGPGSTAIAGRFRSLSHPRYRSAPVARRVCRPRWRDWQMERDSVLGLMLARGSLPSTSSTSGSACPPNFLFHSPVNVVNVVEYFHSFIR